MHFANFAADPYAVTAPAGVASVAWRPPRMGRAGYAGGLRRVRPGVKCAGYGGDFGRDRGGAPGMREVCAGATRIGEHTLDGFCPRAFQAPAVGRGPGWRR